MRDFGWAGNLVNHLLGPQGARCRHPSEHLLRAEAAYVERCDDQPAPDPACCFATARLTRLLLSSDLLRVAAWVAVGLCLGSGFALVVGGLLH